MSIIDKVNKKIKYFIDLVWVEDFNVLIFVISCSLVSFTLGYYYSQSQIPLQRESTLFLETSISTQDEWFEFNTRNLEKKFFGSKNGTLLYTKKCPSGQRIKSENRVYFDSVDVAKNAGYTLSKSC